MVHEGRNTWASEAVDVIFLVPCLEECFRGKQVFVFCRLSSQGQQSTPYSIITPSGTPDEHPGGQPARRVTNRTSNRLAPLPLWVYPCPCVTWAWHGQRGCPDLSVLGVCMCRLCSRSRNREEWVVCHDLMCEFLSCLQQVTCLKQFSALCQTYVPAVMMVAGIIIENGKNVV